MSVLSMRFSGLSGKTLSRCPSVSSGPTKPWSAPALARGRTVLPGSDTYGESSFAARRPGWTGRPTPELGRSTQGSDCAWIAPRGLFAQVRVCTLYPLPGPRHRLAVGPFPAAGVVRARRTPTATRLRRVNRSSGALPGCVDQEIAGVVAGKRSRLDICRISCRKTHFSGKCSKQQKLIGGTHG